VTVEDILGTIAVLELVSLEQGRRIEPGVAVAAAQAAAVEVLTSRSAATTAASARAEPAAVPA
jgi:hypothetical protein